MAKVVRKRERDSNHFAPANDNRIPNTRRPRMHVVVDNTTGDKRTRDKTVVRRKSLGVEDPIARDGARTKKVRVQRRASASISDDFNMAQEERTTQAALSRSNLDHKNDTTQQSQQKRITQADITRSAAGWEDGRSGAEYSSVSDDFRRTQNAQTTRSQLREKRQLDGQRQRLRARNAQVEAEHRARTTAPRRITRTHAANTNQRLTGRGNPLQKLAARVELLAALKIAGFATPFLVIAYILFLIGVFFAAQTFGDAVDHLFDTFDAAFRGEINLGQLFLDLALGSLNAGVITILGLTEYVTGFNLAAALAFIAYIFGATVGVGLIGTMLIIYAITPGVHPLWGKRAIVKWILFLLTLILHVLPLVFFAPWFLIWAWYVARHPA